MRGDANRAAVSEWVRRFGSLREGIDEALADDMNTHEVVNAVQKELRTLTKAILENKAGVPCEATKEELRFVKELLADLGFQLRPREENEALNGELMDSLCQFRRDIREVCLKGLKESMSKEVKESLSKGLKESSSTDLKENSSKEVNTNVSKEVLKKCDEVRQLVSDKHHCSIIDGKGDTLWVKGELPKKETKKEAKKQSNQLTPDCPPSEMFKRTGEFSQFDAAGFPLLDKNGKPLSPTKQKKLRKRYETHKAIHEKWLLQHKAYSVCQQTRQLYSFVSSSDTEYGLNTPRSVIKKVMYSGGR